MPPQLNTTPIVADIPELEISAVHNAAAVKAKELLTTLDSASRKDVATHVAEHIKAHGLSSLDEFAVIAALEESLAKAGKAGANEREGACMCITALCEQFGAAVVPYVLPLLPQIIELIGDKFRPVQLAAQASGDAIIAALSPNAVRMAMTHLLAKNTRWQSNLFRMQVST